MADFDFVTAHIATGAAITSSNDVAALVAAGVTHCIDCRDDFDDAQLLASTPGLQYVWNGTPDDGSSKPPSWFAVSLAFALPALCVSPGTAPRPRVYAHCAAGVNRGPSTAFAILLALDWDPLLAETQIRANRPQVGLAYKQDALAAMSALGFA